MTMIDQVASALQETLTTTAYRLGRQSGFVQRETKLNGAVFTQTLVFTYMADPQATLEELTQTAASLGVVISVPGLDQRFTAAAADLLHQLLAAALTKLLAGQSWDLPVLSQFSHVFVEDGTLIRLPADLAERWLGCKSSNGQQTAVLKLLVRFDLLTGLLETLSLHPGHVHDSAAAAPSDSLPPGSLYLADLGFFCLERVAAIEQQQAFSVTRFKLGTCVWDAAGRRWDDVVELLEQSGADVVDQPVELGAKRQVAGRLVAVRAPQEVVDQRRRRIREQARSNGRTATAARLAAAAWSIFFTTVPCERLPAEALLAVARVRWQIELLFKTWKSCGEIDQSRSKKPWRVLCDVYAKLLAMLIVHWIELTEGWGRPEHSMVKAVQLIRKYALNLALNIYAWDWQGLRHTLTTIARVLATTCRMTTRKGKPNTYQLLGTASEHLLT